MNTEPIPWDITADYIAAANIVEIVVKDDLATICLEIGYARIRDQQTLEAMFRIECLNCAYFTFSRSGNHDLGSGTILEAYLHKSSSLINDLLSNKLESKVGALMLHFPSHNGEIRHLEIVGEISINILCEEVNVYQTEGNFSVVQVQR